MLNTSTTLLRLAALCTMLIPPMILFAISAADVLLSLAGLLFLAESLRKRDFTWGREGWFRLAMLLWLYMILRLLALEHPFESWTNVVFWGRYPLFVAAARHWLLKPEWAQKRLWNSLAASIAFLMFDALLQYFHNTDLLGHPMLEGTTYIRLTGPFVDPKLGIVLVWLTFPVVCALLQGTRLRQAAGIAALILFVLVEWLSGERTALLMTLFGLGWMLVLLPISRKLLALGLMGFAALAALLSLQMPKLVERQLYSTVETISHFGDTVYGNLWKTALRMIGDHPLFGVGPKQFRRACTLYTVPTGNHLTDVDCVVHMHPHNFYLEWAAQYGFVGLALFIALLFLCGKYVRCAFAHERGNLVFTGLLIALMVKLWPLTTTTSFYPTWSALPFWLMLGWMLALCRNAEQRC